MKVKIFYDDHPGIIESCVNAWLADKENVDIIDIKYVACGSGNGTDAFESYSAMIIYRDSESSAIPDNHINWNDTKDSHDD